MLYAEINVYLKNHAINKHSVTAKSRVAECDSQSTRKALYV